MKKDFLKLVRDPSMDDIHTEGSQKDFYRVLGTLDRCIKFFPIGYPFIKRTANIEIESESKNSYMSPMPSAFSVQGEVFGFYLMW